MQTTDREQKELKDFYFIAKAATALGFGCLGAFLSSLKDLREDVTFVFSVWTVVFFLTGAAVGWGMWAIVQKRTAKASGIPPSTP